MAAPPLPRRWFLLLVALLLGFAPALGLLPVAPPQAAEAFNPPVHIEMFEQALQAKFDLPGRTWVAEGLTRSDDNLAGQGRAEWHFDSADSPAAICRLWRAGPETLLNEAARQAVEAFRIVPTDPKGFDRLGSHRSEALRFYGQYLHAIQDFYTHTNWLELHLDPTKPHTLTTIPALAPVQKECVEKALPKALQSGLFAFDPADMFATIVGGAPDFCGPVTAQGPSGPVPTPRPPQNSGFRYCHGPPHPTTIREILSSIPQFLVNMVNQQAGRDVTVSTLAPTLMLSKDLPDTYHEEAKRLATEATKETFDEFKKRVMRAFGASPDLKKRDHECLFQVLVKGGDPACPRADAGGLYRSETALAAAVEMWDIGRAPEAVVRAFRVEIALDPATRPTIVGGTLSIEVVNEPAQRSIAYEGSVPQADPLGEVIPDDATFLAFVGTLSRGDATVSAQGAPLDYAAFFGLARDDAGRLVLCQTDVLALPEAHERRGACLADPVAVLEPVGSAEPTPIS
jgi:hypothetical protein